MKERDGRCGISVSSYLVAAFVLFISAPGCTEMIARKIIAPAPNAHDVGRIAEQLKDMQLLQGVETITVGSTQGRLYCWIFEPWQHAVFAAEHKLTTDEIAAHLRDQNRQWDGAIKGWGWPPIVGPRWVYTITPVPGQCTGADPPQWRGTVILMHGHPGALDDGVYLVPLAALLADAGYRVVYVDLRGQGLSSGPCVTYGKVETRDISDLIDNLQARGLAGQQVIAIGHSYGAGGALAIAADQRVGAAVSLSVGPSLRQALRTVRVEARNEAPLAYFLLSPWVTDKVWQDAVTRAGQIANFDPDQADPAIFIGRTSAPVLLVHGTKDENCPAEICRNRVYAARPQGTDLLTYEGENHWSYLTRDDFRTAVLQWLEKHFHNRPLTYGGPIPSREKSVPPVL